MSTAAKLYDQNGFTHNKGHALADVRHQFDSNSVEILFLQWNVLYGMKVA